MSGAVLLALLPFGLFLACSLWDFASTSGAHVAKRSSRTEFLSLLSFPFCFRKLSLSSPSLELGSLYAL